VTFRNDPTWLQAQQVFINPDAAGADDRMLQSIAAAVTMWAIERAGGGA
jgi:hypothetical protein